MPHQLALFTFIIGMIFYLFYSRRELKQLKKKHQIDLQKIATEITKEALILSEHKIDDKIITLENRTQQAFEKVKLELISLHHSLEVILPFKANGTHE